MHAYPCNAPVAHFEQTANGFQGELTSGIPFTQVNIVNDYTKLQKFTLEDAYWYISDKGIIYADTDLEALSIYLAQ